MRSGFVVALGLAATTAFGVSGEDTDTYLITPELEAALATQARDEPRERGTEGEMDWRYSLPEGVSTRQVRFFSDETECHAKLFLPSGWSDRGEQSYPAVVLGHGFNAIAIALEKYAARFAEAGLVAMAIDYRGYGFSDPWVSLLEPEHDGTDLADDRPRVTESVERVRLLRTRLIAQKQAEDYRSAISWLQGEPGVDPDRIGVWGSSHAGGVVITVAGLDARVKAVVAQVSGVSGRDREGPVPLEGDLLEDAIARARKGRGKEWHAGFSFRGWIDLETRQTGREHRPWQMLDRIPRTTAILWIPAEQDELIPPRGRSGPFAAAEEFDGIDAVLEIPHVTHFQVYSGAAFEVSAGAATAWFREHLGGAR